jgi:hypothetical protein
LDSAPFSVANKMRLQNEAIKHASTMAKISFKNGKSSYEKFFGAPSPTTPETCISNLGRVGYVTHRNIFKNKYKPRAFMGYMVGYAMNHSPHTYKIFYMNQEKQEKSLLHEMLDRYIGIIQVNQNQRIYHHYLQKLKVYY